MKQGAVEVCEGLGIPVQIIGHDRQQIQALTDFFEFEVLVILFFGWKCSGEEQARTDGVELTPKFRHNGGEILFVLWMTGLDTSLYGVFQVKIDAIQDSR